MSAATRPPRHPAAAAEARDGGRRREAVAGRGGTDLLSSSGGGGAALRVVGGGGPPRWRSGGGGGGARGASHPRTRGGGRRRSVGLSPFFRGVFFSFFFPFYSSSGLGLGRRIVSYRRACARLLLVWASRRVALFFSFFFFWSRWRLVCVLACVNMGRRAHRQSDADVAGFPIRAASESVRC